MTYSITFALHKANLALIRITGCGKDDAHQMQQDRRPSEDEICRPYQDEPDKSAPFVAFIKLPQPRYAEGGKRRVKRAPPFIRRVETCGERIVGTNRLLIWRCGGQRPVCRFYLSCGLARRLVVLHPLMRLES